ncbi:ABC_transporter-like [Hexamita inflata]|uniref:ABC transporter-like n=1 Tax=Hexamita inflata TaxID=28002 RepID=A0AA86R9J6_9EUKA|nr:ABC transporter-like [Hexamita inflata]
MQTLLIMGPSGSGKTTLMKAISDDIDVKQSIPQTGLHFIQIKRLEQLINIWEADQQLLSILKDKISGVILVVDSENVEQIVQLYENYIPVIKKHKYIVLVNQIGSTKADDRLFQLFKNVYSCDFKDTSSTRKIFDDWVINV